MHNSKHEDVDYYLGTIARCEPDLHMIGPGTGWASVAVSLKRIADSVEELLIVLKARDERMAELPPSARPWP